MKWELLCAAVVIDSTNNTLKFQEGGGGLTYTCTIPVGTYYLDGTVTPADLATAVADALTAESALSGGAETYNITFVGKTLVGGVTGTVVVVGSNDIELIDSGSTFPFALLGFPQADTGSSTTLTSTLSPTHTWVSNQPYKFRNLRSRRQPKKQHLAADGVTVYSYSTGGVSSRRRFVYALTTEDRTWILASSADDARAFEAFGELLKENLAFRVYRVAQSLTGGTLAAAQASDLVGTYKLLMPNEYEFEPEQRDGPPLFDFEFEGLQQ